MGAALAGDAATAMPAAKASARSVFMILSRLAPRAYGSHLAAAVKAPYFYVIFAAVFALGHAASAQSGAAQYDACLRRAQSDPQAALLLASSWEKNGGGAAAQHCEAVAMIGLRQYPEAARKLEALAQSGDKAMRSALYDQAGNAWMLAANADSAVDDFTRALSADPLDPDLLADRGRAEAFRKNWAKAESDLNAALLVAPDRADLLVLRGSARHGMGRKADARADFDAALRLQPNNADALLERGVMKLEAGDVAGARADWQSVVAAHPGSIEGETARQHLADLDRARPPRR